MKMFIDNLLHCKRFWFIGIVVSMMIPLTVAAKDIKGIIKNKHDDNPIANVVIQIICEDSEITTLSDSVGKFLIAIPDSVDSFDAIFTHVAYNPYSTKVIADSLLYVYLIPKDNYLDEVVVKADWITHREGVSFVNVSAIPNVDKYQADKMLEQIPGIIRSEQGFYSLNGEDAVIYINGVRQNISPSSLSSFLSSLPANAVSSVKLVPVNTGQYASAVNSVIDIKINDNMPLGYTFQPVVYTKYKDREVNDAGSDLFFMKKKGRWLMHHSLSYNNESMKAESLDSLIMGGQLYSSNHTDKTGRCNVINYQGSFSYKMKNENNLIFDTFVYNDFSDTRSEWNNMEVSSMENRNSRNDLYNVSAAYSILSEKKLFNGVVNYSLSYGGRHAVMDRMTANGNASLKGKKEMEGWMNYLSATFNTDIQWIKFTYGTQLEYNSVWDSSRYDELQTEWNASRFTGDERLVSVFGQVRYCFTDVLGLQAGARVEYTDYSYRPNGQQKVKTSFTDLFPTVMLNFDTSVYYGALGMISQIYRADYQEMLPGLAKINDYVYSKGNPDLKPTDAYKFFWNNTWFKFLQTNFTYTYAKDAMADVYQVEQDAMVISKCNAADYHQFKMNAVLPFTFWSDVLTGQLQFNTSYKKMVNLKNGFQLPEGRKPYYWKSSFDAVVNYNPSDRLSVMLSARHIPELQGSLYTESRIFTMNANLAYSFLKEKNLTVSAYVNGLFGEDVDTSDYFLNNRYFTRSVYRGPQIGISLKWRLKKGQDIGEEYRAYSPNTSRFQ